MTIHAYLRQVDRTRATRALTAWLCDDKEALDEVLSETVDDTDGPAGLVFSLLDYAAWVSTNTGPLTEPGPGEQDQA